MGKWLLSVALLVLVVGVVAPHISARLRLGSLPGDVTLRLRGRRYSFPFTSTIILSLLAYLLLRLL